MRRAGIWLAGIVVATAVACNGGEKAKSDAAQSAAQTAVADTTAVKQYVAFGELVTPGDSLSRIRYADGQISINDRCAVRKVRLNRRMPPAYVNGEPVGFC